MRRPWIKIETCTPDKPEICSLSTQLRMDEDTVMGKLVRLWSWAELNRIDPNDLSVTKEFIDRVVGRKGFALALEHTGWLVDTNGKLSFRNFKRHNSPVAQNKALTAKRVARHRLRKAGANDELPSTALPKREKGTTKRAKKVVNADHVEDVKIRNIDLEVGETVFISDHEVAVKNVTIMEAPIVATDAPQESMVVEVPTDVAPPSLEPVREAVQPLPEQTTEGDALVIQAEELTPKKKRAKAAVEADDQPMLF